MTPKVSAIVLNYGTPKLAVRCVRALLKQTMANQLEIFVVDNHSNDESIQYIRNAFRDNDTVHILESRENIGFGRGNNIAIEQSHSDYILIINPDNELAADGLKQMVETMEKDSSIGIIGPKLMHDDGTVRPSARAFPSVIDLLVKRTFPNLFKKRIDKYLGTHEPPDTMRNVDWLVGACLLIRTDVYRALGGFDPRFFLFFEDTDLCRRAKQAGKRVVYMPSVVATDRKKRLSEGSPFWLLTKKTMRIHLWSGAKYFLKWGFGGRVNPYKEA